MDFISDIDAVKRSLIESTELIKSFEDGFGDSVRDEMKKLAEEMTNKRLQLGERLIRLKDNQKRIDNTLRQASADSNTLEEFKEKLEELNEMEKKKRVNIKLTTEYKKFKKEILGVSNDAEADDIEVVNIVSMYDPWSKALMVDPVLNTKCGHYYDRESVTAMIKDNNSVRCPVAGCASKSYIDLNSLKADGALLERIRNYKAEQEALDASSSEDEN